MIKIWINITITAVYTASTTNQHLEDSVVVTESGYYKIFARLSQVEHLKDVVQRLKLQIKMATLLIDVATLSQTVFVTLSKVINNTYLELF